MRSNGDRRARRHRRRRKRRPRAATVQRAASSRYQNSSRVNSRISCSLQGANSQRSISAKTRLEAERQHEIHAGRRRDRTRTSGSCARRCVSVTAVNSSAEITETTLEASMIRMNWLPSAGKTARSAGIRTTKRKICQRLQAERPAGLDLSARHRLDARAHDLGRIGADIDDHREQRRLVGRQPDADRRQAEIDQQKLHQERRVADGLDVGLGDAAQRRTTREFFATARRRCRR